MIRWRVWLETFCKRAEFRGCLIDGDAGPKSGDQVDLITRGIAEDAARGTDPTVRHTSTPLG